MRLMKRSIMSLRNWSSPRVSREALQVNHDPKAFVANRHKCHKSLWYILDFHVHFGLTYKP